jgi:hypothetical protein
LTQKEKCSLPDVIICYWYYKNCTTQFPLFKLLNCISWKSISINIHSGCLT